MVKKDAPPEWAPLLEQVGELIVDGRLVKSSEASDAEKESDSVDADR